MSGSESSGNTKSSIQERSSEHEDGEDQVTQWDSASQASRGSRTSRLSSRSNRSTQSKAERKAQIAILQVQREAEQRRAEVEAEQAALEAQRKQQKLALGAKLKQIDIQEKLDAALAEDKALEEEEEGEGDVSTVSRRMKEHYTSPELEEVRTKDRADSYVVHHGLRRSNFNSIDNTALSVRDDLPLGKGGIREAQETAQEPSAGSTQVPPPLEPTGHGGARPKVFGGEHDLRAQVRIEDLGKEPSQGSPAQASWQQDVESKTPGGGHVSSARVHQGGQGTSTTEAENHSDQVQNPSRPAERHLDQVQTQQHPIRPEQSHPDPAQTQQHPSRPAESHPDPVRTQQHPSRPAESHPDPVQTQRHPSRPAESHPGPAQTHSNLTTQALQQHNNKSKTPGGGHHASARVREGGHDLDTETARMSHQAPYPAWSRRYFGELTKSHLASAQPRDDSPKPPGGRYLASTRVRRGGFGRDTGEVEAGHPNTDLAQSSAQATPGGGRATSAQVQKGEQIPSQPGVTDRPPVPRDSIRYRRPRYLTVDDEVSLRTPAAPRAPLEPEVLPPTEQMDRHPRTTFSLDPEPEEHWALPTPGTQPPQTAKRLATDQRYQYPREREERREINASGARARELPRRRLDHSPISQAASIRTTEDHLESLYH